jgi:hypothetical protein
MAIVVVSQSKVSCDKARLNCTSLELSADAVSPSSVVEADVDMTGFTEMQRKYRDFDLGTSVLTG